MPRKGENIYKRKDGRWEARYMKGRKPDGKAYYGYVYARSYYEVKRKVRDRIKKEGSTTLILETSRKKQDILLSEIAQMWLLGIQPQVKASTFAKYNNLIYSYIVPYYGACPVSKITTGSMEVFCEALTLNGGKAHTGLSPKTISDVLSVFRSVLRYAKRQQFHPGCDGKDVSVKQEHRQIQVLSRQSQKRLVSYLIEHLTPRNMGILICLFTGLRIGEICALRWEDISLLEKTIYVHQTMQRVQIPGSDKPKTKVIVTSPKSICSVRRIPIPDELWKAMSCFSGEHCGYLLTGKADKFMEPRLMEKHFKAVLEVSHIEHVNFHVLRHTFATRCVELGFDVKSLSEILGHANTTITMNRYVHPSMEVKRQNMDKLSSLLLVN